MTESMQAPTIITRPPGDSAAEIESRHAWGFWLAACFATWSLVATALRVIDMWDALITFGRWINGAACVALVVITIGCLRRQTGAVVALLVFVFASRVLRYGLIEHPRASVLVADAALAIVLTALTYVAVHRNTRLREATIRYEHPKLHRLLRDYCSYSYEALASELAACGAAITRSAEDRVDATLATADADLELTTAISGGTLTGIAVDGKIGRLRCRIRKGSLIGIV